MNSNPRHPVRRPGARLAGGIVGAVIGFGLIASVVHGLSGRSAGQSLGDFMAQQRAIAISPVALAAPARTAAPSAARGQGG